MLYCSECGAQVPGGSAFCYNCGSRLEIGGVPVRRSGAAEEDQQEPRESADPGAANVGAASTWAAVPTASFQQAVMPAGSQAPGARYFLASAVIVTLIGLGLLTFILGVVGGAAAAADCQTGGDGINLFQDDSSQECSGGERAKAFFIVTIAGLLVAAFFFWSAYVLRLLSDIEAFLRASGVVQKRTGPP